jgi:hypothetical protein
VRQKEKERDRKRDRARQRESKDLIRHMFFPCLSLVLEVTKAFIFMWGWVLGSSLFAGAFAGDLPDCQIYSENQCIGNEVVTDPSFESHRWFTPRRGDSDYLSSFQVTESRPPFLSHMPAPLGLCLPCWPCSSHLRCHKV